MMEMMMMMILCRVVETTPFLDRVVCMTIRNQQWVVGGVILILQRTPCKQSATMISSTSGCRSMDLSAPVGHLNC